MNFRPHTLRFKISVVYVAVIGLVLILFQVVLYFYYVNSVSRAFDQQLQMKAEQIGGAVNTFRDMLGSQEQALTLASHEAVNLNIDYPSYTFMPESPEKFWLADAKKLGLDQDYLVIMDQQGNVITQSKNVAPEFLSYLQKIKSPNLSKTKFYQPIINRHLLRIVSLPYNYSYGQAYIIVVGTSYGRFERAVFFHLIFVLGCTLVFLVIASLVVRMFVARVLSPVMEISKMARNISQENLHARIKVKHADQEIQHLTGSLNEMIARLEKSFAHIKEFSLEMAHEVKTPLAIISGESQLALEGEHSPDEYKEIFGTVFKEAKRTQKFVSDLLLLTKLDYRLIQLNFESIDLTEFLREICTKMQTIAAAKRITIHQDIGDEAMMIRGDKIHLRRVFFNLIDNALKFTPYGGRICVTVRDDHHQAVILVSDTGCGIADSEMSKIFDKFYRIIENGGEIDSGCGLGLSIVHSIITTHGGTVSVDSEIEKGTTFIINLPMLVAVRN